MAETIREYLNSIGAAYQEAEDGDFVCIPDAAAPGECFDQYELAAISESNLEALSLPECDGLSDIPEDRMAALATDGSGLYAAWMRGTALIDHPDLVEIMSIITDYRILDEGLYQEKLRENFDDDDDYADWSARESGDEESMIALQEKDAAWDVACWLNDQASENPPGIDSLKNDLRRAARKYGEHGETDPVMLLSADIWRLSLSENGRNTELFACEPRDFDLSERPEILEFCKRNSVKEFDDGFTLEKDGVVLACIRETCFDALENRGIELDFSQTEKPAQARGPKM